MGTAYCLSKCTRKPFRSPSEAVLHISGKISTSTSFTLPLLTRSQLRQHSGCIPPMDCILPFELAKIGLLSLEVGGCKYHGQSRVLFVSISLFDGHQVSHSSFQRDRAWTEPEIRTSCAAFRCNCRLEDGRLGAPLGCWLTWPLRLLSGHTFSSVPRLCPCLMTPCPRCATLSLRFEQSV